MAALLPDPEPVAVLASQPTLAETLGRERLPLSRILAYATQIAGELREMHQRGAAHGEVCTAGILLGPGGASLAPSRPYVVLYKAQSDIEGWGNVLWEMLTGSGIPARCNLAPPPDDSPRHGPESVLPSAQLLALKCVTELPARRPSMVQIYTEVRVLSLLARRYQLHEVPAPVPAPPQRPVPEPAPSRLASLARSLFRK